MSPSILVQVQAAIESGRANATQIATIIRADPALLGTTLRLVNSAFFGLPQPIGRPTAAVAYLGLQEIHRLVVSASLINTFSKTPGVELRALWRHSTLTGLVARDLIKSRARWLSSSVGWTLGLLHDVGSLCRLTVEPETEARVAEYCEVEEALPDEAEEVLGLCPSTQWGRELCEEWRLPVAFQTVASHHRHGVAPRTAAVDDAAYLAIVSAAALIARLVGSPLRQEIRAAVASRVCVLLDCNETELWDLLAQAHALRPEAEHALGELLRGPKS